MPGPSDYSDLIDFVELANLDIALELGAELSFRGWPPAIPPTVSKCFVVAGATYYTNRIMVMQEDAFYQPYVFSTLFFPNGTAKMAVHFPLPVGWHPGVGLIIAELPLWVDVPKRLLPG